MSYFKVLTQGQTLVVDITNNAGTAVTTYTTSALSSSHTLPLTITSDTEFHFAAVADRAPHILTVTQLDGTVLYSATVEPHPSKPHIIGPEPTALQVGADAARVRALPLAPTGAIAETFSRMSASTANLAALVSGRMSMVAIPLEKGVPISSASFLSATTAAGTPTAQWFALYDSDLALLGQTEDDTTTAWAANSIKTLSFATTVTPTYSGLHYLAINVTATTPPSLRGCASQTDINGLAPKIAATSTTGLTDTAPDPAGALTATTTIPYAYVS